MAVRWKTRSASALSPWMIDCEIASDLETPLVKMRQAICWGMVT